MEVEATACANGEVYDSSDATTTNPTLTRFGGGDAIALTSL